MACCYIILQGLMDKDYAIENLRGIAQSNLLEVEICCLQLTGHCLAV
jgi:hypothetical protein